MPIEYPPITPEAFDALLEGSTIVRALREELAQARTEAAIAQSYAKVASSKAELALGQNEPRRI